MIHLLELKFRVIEYYLHKTISKFGVVGGGLAAVFLLPACQLCEHSFPEVLTLECRDHRLSGTHRGLYSCTWTLHHCYSGDDTPP